MKNKRFFTGILSFWLIFGLFLAGCSTGDDDGGNTGGNTAVTFSSVTANGSSTQTTTQLTLTFSQAITGLSAGDITLSGVSGVSKGTLSGSGPSYTLGISGFTSGGTLSVAVAKSGYTISGSPKSAPIFYYNVGDTIVTLSNVTANGSATETTTQLTLTFSQAITGLSVSDITLSGVSGVSKGTLSGSGPIYTLGISGFTSGGTLSVMAAKSGYAINGSPKTTAIYYSSGGGGSPSLIAKWYASQNNADTDTSVSFEFTANGGVLLSGNSVGLTYTNNSNTITIVHAEWNLSGTASYVISGTKLTLSNVGADIANLIPAGDYYKKDENNNNIGVVFENIFANGDEYDQTTTQLTLYFDRAIPGLTANDITLSGINGVSKGSLSGSGPEYTLNISGFTSGGTLSVSVAKPGYNIIGSPQTVTIYRHAVGITFEQVDANGAAWQTTTQLTLYLWAQDLTTIPDLTANDITLSGVNGVTKGTLSKRNLGYVIAYDLNISGFSSTGTLTVSVVKPGYDIGPPQTVTIYYYIITLSSLTDNGSATQTSTELTLTFDDVIPDLSVNDITISGVAGVTKSYLFSDLAPIYYLGISGVTSGGTLSVSVAKPGYNITGSPKTVTIYYYNDPRPYAPYGISATATSSSSITVSWNSVPSANGYNIYRRTSLSGAETKVGTSTSTSYTDTGLSANTTYYYKVSAYNTYGESNTSAYLTPATTLSSGGVARPSAPTGVSAAQSGSLVNVSWNSVSGATSYRVYRSSTSMGTYTQIGTSSSTSYPDNSPLSGYNYYKVSAENSAGEGNQSSYAPCNFTATATGPKLPDTFISTRNSASSSVLTILSYKLSDKSLADSYTYVYYIDGQANFQYTNAPNTQTDGLGTTGIATTSGSDYLITISDTSLYGGSPGTYRIKVRIISGSQYIETAERSVTIN